MDTSYTNKLFLGESINLPTAFGDLIIRYIQMDSKEGIVVTGKTPFSNPLPLRIQSSCLFSESLLSSDCDCAAQLHAALEIISNGGLLIYVYEEGRGAGLKTKIDAIRIMQQQGVDTANAYKQLGLQKDLRDYEVVASVIKSMIDSSYNIVLLTNNPSKVTALEEAGIKVSERRPLVCNLNEAVNYYLREKARVLGHIFNND